MRDHSTPAERRGDYRREKNRALGDPGAGVPDFADCPVCGTAAEVFDLKREDYGCPECGYSEEDPRDPEEYGREEVDGFIPNLPDDLRGFDPEDAGISEWGKHTRWRSFKAAHDAGECPECGRDIEASRFRYEEGEYEEYFTGRCPCGDGVYVDGHGGWQ